MVKKRFSKSKDIAKDDYDAIDAFSSFIFNRVRNPAGFYKKLRKDGHKNKMALFRKATVQRKHMAEQDRRRRKWTQDNEKMHFQNR